MPSLLLAILFSIKMLSQTSMSCFKSWIEIKKSDQMIFNLSFDDFLKSNL